jgi:flagellar hook-length control protein FliK
MEAITNSNPELAAVVASPANVQAPAAQGSSSQSIFTDCLERALQDQGTAAQQDGSSTVTSSANSQSSSATDCSPAPRIPQIASQNASQNSTPGCGSTLTVRTGAGAASRNPKQGPSQKQSAEAPAAAGVAPMSASAVPVQDPIMVIAANVASTAPFLSALPVPVTVAPEPATEPVIAKACVAAQSGGLSSVLTTSDLVAPSNISPSICGTPISSKPAALNQGSANSQPGTPVVAGSMVAQVMPSAAMPTFPAAALISSPPNQAQMPGQATSERSAKSDTGTSPKLAPSVSSPAAPPASLNQGSANLQPGTPVVVGSMIAQLMPSSAMPMVPAAALNMSLSNQAPMPGQATSERSAKSDTGTSPKLNPSVSSPAAPLAEKIIRANDVASGHATGTIVPDSSDSKGALKHQDKSGGDPQTIESSTPTVPSAGVDQAGEPQTPRAFIHAIEKQVESNAPQSSIAIGHDPSLQPTSHAAKTGGDSAPSVSREYLHVQGLEPVSAQKSSANSDFNGSSSNTSTGQSSAVVPPPVAHGIAQAMETNFSSHIDNVLNSAALKQEVISTASNSSGTPATGGSTAAATGSAVSDRRDSEVASTRSAWDMVSAHAERLVQSAQLSQNAGQAEMRIHLSTEAMGSVELRTTVQQDHIAAAITVQRSETQAALLGELPSLQQALQNRQLQIDRLDINYGGQNSGMSGQNESNSQNGGFESPQNSSRNWAHADSEPVRSEFRAELESGLDGSRTLSVRA